MEEYTRSAPLLLIPQLKSMSNTFRTPHDKDENAPSFQIEYMGFQDSNPDVRRAIRGIDLVKQKVQRWTDIKRMEFLFDHRPDG